MGYVDVLVPWRVNVFCLKWDVLPISHQRRRHHDFRKIPSPKFEIPSVTYHFFLSGDTKMSNVNSWESEGHSSCHVKLPRKPTLLPSIMKPPAFFAAKSRRFFHRDSHAFSPLITAMFLELLFLPQQDSDTEEPGGCLKPWENHRAALFDEGNP